MENLKTDQGVTIVGVEVTFYKGSTNKVVRAVEKKLIKAAKKATENSYGSKVINIKN